MEVLRVFIQVRDHRESIEILKELFQRVSILASVERDTVSCCPSGKQIRGRLTWAASRCNVCCRFVKALKAASGASRMAATAGHIGVAGRVCIGEDSAVFRASEELNGTSAADVARHGTWYRLHNLYLANKKLERQVPTRRDFLRTVQYILQFGELGTAIERCNAY